MTKQGKQHDWLIEVDPTYVDKGFLLNVFNELGCTPKNEVPVVRGNYNHLFAVSGPADLCNRPDLPEGILRVIKDTPEARRKLNGGPFNLSR